MTDRSRGRLLAERAAARRPASQRRVSEGSRAAETRSFGPAVDVLDLQRRAGNVAVVELLRGTPPGVRGAPLTIQRQPAGTQHAPLTEGMSEDDADHLAQEVLKDFHAFYRRLMNANTIGTFTHYRDGLMKELDAIGVDAAVDRGVFTKPLDHMDAITTISEKLAAITAKLADQNAKAKKVWTWLESEVARERAALSAGSFGEQTASKILGDSFDKAKARVGGLGDLAVGEDFVHVVDMVNKKTHRKFGEEQAARDEEKLEGETAAFDEEMADLEDDDEPGLLSTVWSVVGWDSPWDFVKDVGLTVVTLGYSKYARSAKRGRKAYKKAKKAKLARKLRQGKRLEKVKEIAEAVKRIAKFEELHHAEVTSAIGWVKNNVKSLARKIFTDLVSDAATGGVKGGVSVAVNRITKGYIQAQVDDALDVSEDQGKKYVELSITALRSGKEDSSRRLMRAFLSVALRRRGVTNIIDTVTKKLGSIDIPTSLKSAGVDLANMAITTAGEVINDFINGLPYVNRYRSTIETVIEAGRKFLQKVAQSALG